MKHCLMTLCLYLFMVCSAGATPQVADTLKLQDGTVKPVYGMQFPPESWEKFQRWMKRGGYDKNELSANWKGYFASYSLQNKTLHVDRLYVVEYGKDFRSKETDAPLSKIFAVERAPVPATWFTGELVEYFGGARGYTHVQKRMRVYTFKEGVLISTVERKTPRADR